MPERIQLSRAVGWRKPVNAVVVARPSRWGNPFKVGERHPQGPPIEDAAQAVSLYRNAVGNLLRGIRYPAEFNPLWNRWKSAEDFHHDLYDQLKGKDLACWCPLDSPCHADVLLELVAAMPERQTFNAMADFAAAVLASRETDPS